MQAKGLRPTLHPLCVFVYVRGRQIFGVVGVMSPEELAPMNSLWARQINFM